MRRNALSGAADGSERSRMRSAPLRVQLCDTLTPERVSTGHGKSLHSSSQGIFDVNRHRLNGYLA